MKLRRIAIALMLLGLLPACIQFRMTLQVYPDGSGKVTYRFATKSGTMDLLGALSGEKGEDAEDADEGIPGDLGEVLSAEEFADRSEGIVAWTDTRKFEEGSYEVSEVTGYFEDIREVRMKGDMGELSDANMTFDWQKDENGSHVLTFGEQNFDDLLDESAEEDPFDSAMEKGMAKGMMKAMMGDFYLSYVFRMPGEVQVAEGMKISGREAEVRFDVDALVESLENPNELYDEIGDGIVSAPGADEIHDEMVEFQKEMKEARARWEDIQAARRSDAESADEPGDGPGDEPTGEPRSRRRTGWY